MRVGGEQLEAVLSLAAAACAQAGPAGNPANVREVVFRLDGSAGPPALRGVEAEAAPGNRGRVVFTLAGSVPAAAADPAARPAAACEVGRGVLAALKIDPAHVAGLTLRFDARGAVVAQIDRYVSVAEVQGLVAGPLATLGGRLTEQMRGKVVRQTEEVPYVEPPRR